jgi:GntR family transcriptional regulator
MYTSAKPNHRISMPASKLPKSRQVYIALRDRIAQGFYDPMGGLPGEQSLAAEFGVSRVTLRRALAELESDGFIDRRRGAGTFLNAAGTPAPIVIDLADALAQLGAMGASTDVKLHDFAYEVAPANVCEALKLAPGARVQRSLRTRLLDGQPFSWLTTFVPEKIGETYTRDELSKKPLLSLLERAGYEIDHAIQDIGAELATPDAAKALHVDIGTPLISLSRTVFDATGCGIEHLRALYRPDRYRFRMELTRAGERDTRHWEPLSPSLTQDIPRDRN